MKVDSQKEAAVVAAVKNWLSVYETRDVDALMMLFSPESEVVLIGTGVDEKRVGLADIRAQMERDFAQSDSISAELGWYSVSAAESAAWLAADSVFRVSAREQVFELLLRLTAVLELVGDRWMIAQWHVSAPAAEQSKGQSW